MSIFTENGANVGTMGAGTGADIIGSPKNIDKTKPLLKKKNKIQVFPMHIKEGKERSRMNKKEKAEAKREKGMSAKHFGEAFTSNANNNDGGTNNDVIRTGGFSNKVMAVIKAARQRDKKDDPYFARRAKELKLNKEEDNEMDFVADIFNSIITEGRGRPRKNAADPKWAAHDREHGDDDEADQNIHMQMKKAAGVEQVHTQLDKPSIEKPVQKSFHEVKYGDGTTQKVSPRIANKWLTKHESLKPEGKLQMQIHSQKSHKNLMQAIGEELEESSSMPSTAVGVKCKSCGEGHKESGKVMMNGYHTACTSVSGKAAEFKKKVNEAFGSAKAVGDRNNNSFKDLNWYPKVTLKFSKDAEPSCPNCGHYNAMLHKHDAKKDNLFKCRDCNHTVQHVKEENIEEGRRVHCPTCKGNVDKEGHKVACPEILKLKKWSPVKKEDVQEGRIADALQKKKGVIGFHDQKPVKPLDKDAMHRYFKNKYKKANGEVVKNEEVLTETPLVDVDKCPTCKRAKGEKHLATTKRPSISKMEKWVSNGVAKATDGCTTEPDGHCQHGHSSWLLRLGLI